MKAPWKFVALAAYVAALLVAAYLRELNQDGLSGVEFQLFVLLAFGSSLLAGTVLGALALAGPVLAFVVTLALYFVGAEFETFAADPLWAVAVYVLGIEELLVVALGLLIRIGVKRARRARESAS